MSTSGSDRSDRRIFVDHDRKLVVAVSYKSGWSTFNRAIGELSDLKLPNPSNLAEAPHDEYRCVLFMRPPLSRLVSYLNDKVVLRRGTFDTIVNTMAAWGATGILDEIVAARNDQTALTASIDSFLPYLPLLLQKDQHLRPQHNVYSSCGFGPLVFDEIIDYRRNTEFLRQNFGINAKIGNVTRSEEMEDILATPRVQAFCEAWYGLDRLVWDTYVNTESPVCKV